MSSLKLTFKKEEKMGSLYFIFRCYFQVEIFYKRIWQVCGRGYNRKQTSFLLDCLLWFNSSVQHNITERSKLGIMLTKFVGDPSSDPSGHLSLLQNRNTKNIHTYDAKVFRLCCLYSISTLMQVQKQNKSF